MKPRTTLIVIMSVTAFVVAFAISFAASAYGQRSGMTFSFSLMGAGLAVVLVASWRALRNNRKVPEADASQKQAALNDAPAPGTGRLILYREGFVGKMAGVDMLVDGGAVAQLKSPRFTVIDLPAGTHTVSASVQGQTAMPVEVMLASGGAAAVRAAMVIGGIKVVQEDVAAVHPKLAAMPMVLPDGPAAAAQRGVPRP